jgi:16S rRNA (cytosine967-C5)-methyltransferase
MLIMISSLLGSLPAHVQTRAYAARLVDAVVTHRLQLREAMEREAPAHPLKALEPRDAAFAVAIATTTLRFYGWLQEQVGAHLAQGWPRSKEVRALLLTAAAQKLILNTPAHAVVDDTVTLAKHSKTLAHFAPLLNAVLRRLTPFSDLDPLSNLPDWLAKSWMDAYGVETTRRIASALQEPLAVDLTVKDPQKARAWAEKLNAVLLNGTLRLRDETPLPHLEGYDEGAWWAQDVAASLPVRLFPFTEPTDVLDMCAAPGGKTMQLAAMGHRVTAVDRSNARLVRVHENLARTKLSAEVICAQAEDMRGTYAGVLLDAPCSATGTTRRHPDGLWNKTPHDVEKLSALQTRLLDHAATLVAPSGTLVFATCSLQPLEGEAHLPRFLAKNPDFEIAPVPDNVREAFPEVCTPHNTLRALPFYHTVDATTPRLNGMDGFFGVAFRRC